MDIALSTAVSGLHAHAQRFRAAAFNVVNAGTEGFTAHRTSSVSQAPSGVRSETFDSGAPVDLAREFVDMSVARIGYAANAKVVTTAERMTGALLDVVA